MARKKCSTGGSTGKSLDAKMSGGAVRSSKPAAKKPAMKAGGRLTYQERKELPESSFVFPGKRKYPINDKAHARNALARVSASGTPAEKKAVKAKVKKKFPSIKVGGK